MSTELIRQGLVARLVELEADIKVHNSMPGARPLVNIDLDPSDAPAVVVSPTPVAIKEGIVPGSMDEHGAADLAGFNRFVQECRESDDKWDLIWVSQKDIAHRFILPSFELLPGLTDAQRLSIRANTANAGKKYGLNQGADASIPEPWRHKMRCWPAFPVTPNESGLGQLGWSWLPGVFAFCATSEKLHEMLPEDGYGFGKQARNNWLRTNCPEYVREHDPVLGKR